jgi:3-hydroxymyristoyl/3-hydroxydecanoyl-(acyl carrier protein) dehydratase
MRFLFVDRIVDSIPGELIRGIKHITADDSFLTIDEKGRACFIPSLIGETLGQLAAWNVMALLEFQYRPVAGIVARACLHRPAYVGETLILESFIDHLDEGVMGYHSQAKVGEELVFSLEGALGPLLPMDDFIDLESVKQQYAEINRPGDWANICKECAPDSNEGSLLNSELPILSMQFDRIHSSQPGISLIAEKKVSRAAPYFPDHFPKKPVLPLTILLECKLNLAREFIARAGYTINYKVSELRRIKMSEFVYPGDILECVLKVKKQTEEELILSYRTEVAGKRVCVVDAVFRG